LIVQVLLLDLTPLHPTYRRLKHITMVAILWLLCLISALLAIPPGSATLVPGVDALSRRQHHFARIAANRGLVLPALSSTPAPPLDTKTIVASRQYNPRKRYPKRRFRGRALASVAPVPNTIFGSFGGGASGTLTLNKFYQGSGFTENDDNPSESFAFSSSTKLLMYRQSLY